MALDNAQFISELSIIDPPGSDPLSQGDDQIRTTKRATFQSFPFINAQVDLTTDQMNLAAIKNEPNVFTATQTIQDNNLLLDAVADVALSIEMSRGGLFRWFTTMAADSGNNNWILARFDDLGGFIDRPMEVDRATGVVSFSQVPTVQGAPLWIAGEIRQFVGSVTPGTNWFLADGTNGTKNLADRWLVGSGAFAGAPGTDLNANLDATAAAGTTGGTALSEAQMPSHHHALRDLQVGGGITDGTALTACNSVSGVRNTVANIFTDAGLSGQFVQNTGSGSTHNHSSPAQNVTANNPTFTPSVQPVSVAVQTWQYVP